MIVKANQEDKFCVIVAPHVLNFKEIKPIDNTELIHTQYRPMACLYEKCATYWCAEHQSCLHACEHLHYEVIERMREIEE